MPSNRSHRMSCQLTLAVLRYKLHYPAACVVKCISVSRLRCYGFAPQRAFATICHVWTCEPTLEPDAICTLDCNM